MQLLREHGHMVQDIDELAREVYTFDELMALFRKRRLEEHGLSIWRGGIIYGQQTQLDNNPGRFMNPDVSIREE